MLKPQRLQSKCMRYTLARNFYWLPMMTHWGLDKWRHWSSRILIIHVRVLYCNTESIDWSLAYLHIHMDYHHWREGLRGYTSETRRMSTQFSQVKATHPDQFSCTWLEKYCSEHLPPRKENVHFIVYPAPRATPRGRRYQELKVMGQFFIVDI